MEIQINSKLRFVLFMAFIYILLCLGAGGINTKKRETFNLEIIQENNYNIVLFVHTGYKFSCFFCLF